MLKEILGVADDPPARRRWFHDDYFDLFVWQAGGEVTLIQVCYGADATERALVWDKQRGFFQDGPPAASANSDWLSDIAAPDSAAIGAARRFEQSPYRGAGTPQDFLPLYLYEGSRFYMHSYAVGAKFGDLRAGPRFDLFLRYRFEGYPHDRVPESLAGMQPRESGIDAGFSAQAGGGWGIAYAELLHDISEISRGSELRLGYKYPLRRGRLWLQPQAVLGVRAADLDNYYYGVRPGGAAPLPPAYSAGSGAMTQLGLY